jgi:hypothetical protein
MMARQARRSVILLLPLLGNWRYVAAHVGPEVKEQTFQGVAEKRRVPLELVACEESAACDEERTWALGTDAKGRSEKLELTGSEDR